MDGLVVGGSGLAVQQDPGHDAESLQGAPHSGFLVTVPTVENEGQVLTKNFCVKKMCDH